jgi:hypothetical protein
VIPAQRGPSMDGDGEPAVSKGEETHDAALDERRSMGAARGRGGARAASMPKHRGERGLRCSFLSGRKGEKGVGVVRCCVRSSEGGGRQRTEMAGAGSCRASRGSALGGRSWYGGAWAASGESGPARGEGKWVGPRKTVSGGSGKLI